MKTNEKFKMLYEKVISFRMSNTINQYKVATKQEREKIKLDIEKIEHNKATSSEYEIVISIFSIFLLVFAFFTMPMIMNYYINHEDDICMVFISFVIAGVIVTIFKSLQGNYLLKKFKQIDNEEMLNKKCLKEKIAACNLYLK